MQRRALLQTAALTLLAGCAGGDTAPTADPATDDGEPTGSPAPTSTTYEHTMVTAGSPTPTTTTEAPARSLPGSVVTDGWTAETLAGRTDADASTIQIDGSVRNETGESRTPAAARYDFLDGGGAELAGERVPFEITIEVPPGDTLSIGQTVELGSTDVTRIDRLELDLEMQG